MNLVETLAFTLLVIILLSLLNLFLLMLLTKEKSIYCVQNSKYSSQNLPHLEAMKQ